MGRPVAIDNNVMIHVIKEIREGRPCSILARYQVVVPVAVWGEFLCGFENGDARPEDRHLLDALIEQRLCPVEPFVEGDAEVWARLRVRYNPKGGRTRDATDMFVAAQAVARKLPFVSDDAKQPMFRQLKAAGELDWYSIQEAIEGAIPDEVAQHE